MALGPAANAFRSMHTQISPHGSQPKYRKCPRYGSWRHSYPIIDVSEETRVEIQNRVIGKSGGAHSERGKPVSVILADDHPVVVLGLQEIISQTSTCQVVATAGSVSEMMSALRRNSCDLLICDYAFDNGTDADGIRMIERVRRAYPGVKIILLTAFENKLLARRLMLRGVNAFVGKRSDGVEILPKIIETIFENERYLSMRPFIRQNKEGRVLTGGEATVMKDDLTFREWEVMRLLERGANVIEIARRMNRSSKTISAQKISAMKKLEVKNDVELIHVARRILWNWERL